MTAEEAISYIESQNWSGTRLGLDRTRELLRRLGEPQKKLRFVHVAGTNGKGSACAMLASVLRCAGCRTGIYTSPYICRFNERMQVNGEMISDAKLAALTERIRPLADAMDDHPSQFEIVTALAMQYYLDEGCDIVVLETGLGGELDSTNVIDAPEAAVITNIGLEHTEYLGSTLSEIATAKAGIIKPGCTAVCYRCAAEAETVFEQVCRERGVKLMKADFESIVSLSQSLEGQSFSLGNMKELFLPLLGRHQLENAALVLETVKALRERGWAISDEAFRTGLSRTEWPARLEVLNREPVFLVDGAHNPQCAQALSEGLKLLFGDKKLSFILGVLADKDYEQMLKILKPHIEKVFCVRPDSPRALPAEKLAEILLAGGIAAEACPSIEHAVERAANEGQDCIACGSLYMAGRARLSYLSVKRREIRKACIRARNALTEEERREKNAAISKRIADSAFYKNARTVMLYRAMPGEAEITLPETEGKLFVYPRCTGEGIMDAYAPKAENEWERGTYGITEPKVMAENHISPEEIDLVICPCAGFDAHCGRLGMGKGYYDRFLPRCVNAHTVAAAFEIQRAESTLPAEWDVRMEAVFTEGQCYTADTQAK